MSQEQVFFLRILADHIHGRQSEAAQNSWLQLDWEVLLQIAREQNLSGIFYVQCRDTMARFPELHNALGKLKAAFVAEAAHGVVQQQELSRLEADFTQANIPFLPFKGSVFSQMYPAPQLRTMGDIDLLIHKSDREKTHQWMLQQGFTPRVDCDAVWMYAGGNVIYEIHDQMIYEPLWNQTDYQAYFDHAWEHASPTPGSSRYTLDESYHFLYLIVHTAKHIVNNGYGLRAFLDMTFLVRQAGRRMDWAWIGGELEQLHLLAFTQTCFALCQRWFGVTMPLSSPPLKEAFYREASEKVFRDGLFGRGNPQNEVARLTKQLHRARGPYWLSAMGTTLHKLFPSYENMRRIPWYSFVDGRPWLLPGAWVYRFYYCARYKRHDGSALLAQPYASRARIKEREALISDWGL